MPRRSSPPCSPTRQKRQLSTYRNAEIKTLLADLLGQEIQALGQKAGEIVRLLKAGLATQRQELAGLDAEDQRLDAVRRKLDGAGDRVSAAERAKTAAQAALEAAQARHARVVVEREQSRATDARRAQLVAERQSNAGKRDSGAARSMLRNRPSSSGWNASISGSPADCSRNVSGGRP